MEGVITESVVDETTAGPGVDDLEKVGTPEPEEVNTETEAEAIDNDDSSEGEGEEQEEEAEDLIEFDVGGEKFSIAKADMPEEIREKIQAYAKTIEANSTKKSQTLSEEIKGLEADRKAVQQLERLQRGALDTYTKGTQVRSEAAFYQAELAKVDKETNLTLWQSDPDLARQYSDLLSQKTVELDDIRAGLIQQEATVAQEQTKEQARLFEKGKSTAERLVPGISNKVDEIAAYAAKAYGMTKEEAKARWAIDPGIAVTTYKAMLLDRLQAKVKTTTKSQKTDITPIKPIKGKGRVGAGTKDPGKLNPDDYSKWKKAQQKSGNWG